VLSWQRSISTNQPTDVVNDERTNLYRSRQTRQRGLPE
jgi:hypothetical protein